MTPPLIARELEMQSLLEHVRKQRSVRVVVGLASRHCSSLLNSSRQQESDNDYPLIEAAMTGKFSSTNVFV
jgi:hypothetical protein